MSHMRCERRCGNHPGKNGLRYRCHLGTDGLHRTHRSRPGSTHRQHGTEIGERQESKHRLECVTIESRDWGDMRCSLLLFVTVVSGSGFLPEVSRSLLGGTSGCSSRGMRSGHGWSRVGEQSEWEGVVRSAQRQHTTAKSEVGHTGASTTATHRRDQMWRQRTRRLKQQKAQID